MKPHQPRPARSVLSIVALGLVFGCSGGDEQRTSPITSDEGICLPTCLKPCQSDNDCATDEGEVCCDHGADGKACVQAADCPRFCRNDDRCDVTEGESCRRVHLESAQAVCTQPEAALRTCEDDGDCATDAGEACCEIYDDPVCLAPELCPRPCSGDEGCDGSRGEVCCTTLHLNDSRLRNQGLCIDPELVDCPRPCEQSADCDSTRGEVCCNGICDTSCQKSCRDSSDCDDAVCCKTPAVLSVWQRGPQPIGILSEPPCVSGSDCDTGQTCVADGLCRTTCSSALECLYGDACVTGCDPNEVCNLLECPAARDIAQCIADTCPACFTQGFASDACFSCDTASCLEDVPCPETSCSASGGSEASPPSRSCLDDSECPPGHTCDGEDRCRPTCSAAVTCAFSRCWEDGCTDPLDICGVPGCPEAQRTLQCVDANCPGCIQEGTCDSHCFEGCGTACSETAC